jgi:alcohol dehydrogenase
MPRRVISGPGSISSIVELIQNSLASSVLIVTDKGVWGTGLLEHPIGLLKNAGISVEIINNVPPEPEAQQAQEIIDAARKYRCTMIIGIGGGSAMDIAKLIAALYSGSITVKDLLSGAKIEKKGLPALMIPTTAGTGSEVTPNSIVTVVEQGLKVGIVSPNLMADCVILDPSLTTKLPPAITASTGVDALAHAIECFISKKANPFSDMYALEAIRLIYGSIRKAYIMGDDIQSRHNMLLAAFYGGLCIASSGTTAVHALAYPLGGKYRIPHGVSNAMLLPHVMEFNKDSIVEQLCRIAVAMRLDADMNKPEAVADMVIDELHSLIKDLGLNKSLKEYNVTEKDIPLLVEEAAKVKRLLDNNPKEVSREDMAKIYGRLM